MRMTALLHVPLYALALAGCVSLGVGALVASPLSAPPPLAAMQEGALRLDLTGMPDLSRFQARDGTSLAYRLYPAADGSRDRVAILFHGSSGLSEEMNGLAKALAAAGVTAVAPDVRGHGASGTRGDVAYVGQVEDDLADLLDALGPDRRFALVGFSLGGGFVARVAGTPLGSRFQRLVALSPFLGALAPTNRPNVGAGHWADVDSKRVLGLALLQTVGVTAGQSLPVIHYAADAHFSKRQTTVYSYRLLASYGPGHDWAGMQAGLRAAAPRFTLIAGADDALMDAPAYARELRPLGVAVTVLPGVDHIGMLYRSEALAAEVSSIAQRL